MHRCLLAVLVLVAAGEAAADDRYRSDFVATTQPENLKDWQLTAGQYRLRDGWLEMASDKSNPTAKLTRQIDGGVTFRATVRNALNCHRTWMVIGGAYRLELNRQFGRLELHRLMPSGRWMLVDHAPNPDRYVLNRHAFEMRLVIDAGRIHAFLDDKKLIDTGDLTPAKTDGLELGGGWGSDLAWRDIRVSDAADLNEWPIERDVKPSQLATVTWVRGLVDDNTYIVGEKVGFKFKLTTRQADGKLRLTYRLIDVREKVVAEQAEDVAIALSEKAGQQFGVEFLPPALGAFKVALYASADEGPPAWVEDLGCLIVLPESAGDGPHIAGSYFGGHMDGINLAWHLKSGRRLGVQWARCHDMLQHTWWTRVQPAGPDHWQWFDRTQKTLDELPFATLGEFLWTPRWAAGGKGQASPPKNDADFARYVRETVGHYRESLHHWEVWNEPHYAGFWTGTPEQYAHLLAVAYRAAKQADPKCTVLGGGGVSLGSRDWIARMIAALPAEACMDAFSIHYLVPDTAAEDLAWLRTKLIERDINVPIWNTEESVISTSFLDQLRVGLREPEARYHCRNACSELVRTHMENIANGVRRVFYYELADPWRQGEGPKPRKPDGGGRLGTSLWDEGRMPRPMAASYSAMTTAIEGKRFVLAGGLVDGSGRAFIFAGKKASVAVILGRQRRFAERIVLRLDPPPGVDISDLALTDFMGNARRLAGDRIEIPVSREPVYLSFAGDPDSLARLLIKPQR